MSDDLNDYSSSKMPRGDASTFGWKIVRAPHAREMKLICYSNDMLWLDTHFYLGRTGPHRNFNCIPCKFATPIREKGYLLCQDGPTGQSVIFEFTPPAAKALADARHEYGTLRGCRLNVSRAGSKSNSRVVVVVKDSITLPETACPDYGVWNVLVRIWGLDRVSLNDFPNETDIDLGDDKPLV